MKCLNKYYEDISYKTSKPFSPDNPIVLTDTQIYKAICKIHFAPKKSNIIKHLTILLK